MLTYPKCKDCGHSKSKHTTTQRLFGGRSLNGKDSEICKDCYNFWQYGPIYSWEVDKSLDDIQMYHLYRPDNLDYLERKYEKAAKLHKAC